MKNFIKKIGGGEFEKILFFGFEIVCSVVLGKF